MTNSARERIAVIIGSGAMGVAAARRFGPACRLLVADNSQARLEAAVRSLADDGHRVDAMTMDVRDGEAVAAVAVAAGAAGTVTAVIHTAGVSPSQGSARDIFAINLVGTAYVIDRFLDVASPGTSLVCVASIAGHKQPVDPALEAELATTPAGRLLGISLFDLAAADTSLAYHVAKRGVHLRVAVASRAWGAKGARVNSVSPGIIWTPMSQQELAGERGDSMRSTVATLAVPRVGTPEDIAAAVEFLCSPAASYITGTDLLIDGGATAARRWPSHVAPLASWQRLDRQDPGDGAHAGRPCARAARTRAAWAVPPLRSREVIDDVQRAPAVLRGARDGRVLDGQVVADRGGWRPSGMTAGAGSWRRSAG